MTLSAEDFKADYQEAYRLFGQRYADFVARYWNNLPRYVCENSRHKPTWQQIDICEAVTTPGCRVACASGHGTGKLLRYDAIVPTPLGMRRWGDIVPGDLLFGRDGHPTQVIACHHFEGVPMYRVAFDDGSYADVSSGHLWTVKGRQERRKGVESWRTMETIEILEMGVKRSNGTAMARQWEIPTQEPAHFDERKTSLHPYLMGVWLGDGTVRYPVYSKPHPEIAEKIRTLGYDVRLQSDGKSHRIMDNAELFRGGVFEENSHGRYIPEEYKFNSVENRMALFQGLCDTDGEADGRYGVIGYSTTSKKLAEDVLWLARSLGCKASIQPTLKKGWYPDKDGNRIECRDCYRLTINAPFNPFTIEHRKSRHKRSEARYQKRWIDSIEPLPDSDGMCVTVAAEDGLYLANDFIVTHNSDLAAWVLDWHLRVFPKSNAILTANLLEQCRAVIWKYLDMVIEDMAKAWPWQSDMFIKETKRYYCRGFKDSWYVIPKTAPDAKPENLAGQHDRNLLYLCDEASAISDAKHGVMRGALTHENNRYLMFSQPTRSSGHFAEAFSTLRYDPETGKGIYTCFNLNSEESPIVSKKFIQEKLIEYGGHHSPEYQIKVLGRLPDNLAGFLIPKTWLEDAQKVVIDHGSEPWGWVVTVDVAEGVHRDSSVYAVWKVSGYGDTRKAECVKQVETLDRDELKFARDLYADIRDLPNVTVAVDADGPGRTVILTLEELGMSCERIHWGLPCHMDADKKRYKNQRAFASVKTREAIFNGGQKSRLKLPPGKKVVEQGSKIPYKIDEAGHYCIMPKDQMKNEGIKSPDLFDTVCFVQLVDYVPCSSDTTTEQNALLDMAKRILAGEAA